MGPQLTELGNAFIVLAAPGADRHRCTGGDDSQSSVIASSNRWCGTWTKVLMVQSASNDDVRNGSPYNDAVTPTTPWEHTVAMLAGARSTPVASKPSWWNMTVSRPGPEPTSMTVRRALRAVRRRIGVGSRDVSSRARPAAQLGLGVVVLGQFSVETHWCNVAKGETDGDEVLVHIEQRPG